MKQLTRQEVEAVVEKSAVYYDDWQPGNDSCRCSFRDGAVNCKEHYHLQYPILIGDILSKIDKTVGGRNYYRGQTTYNDELIHLWSRCGKLTESLQEIINDSKWEKIRKYTDLYANIIPSEKKIPTEPSVTEIELLTSPEANALFSFLQEIL